jgi:gas vesicle protein
MAGGRDYSNFGAGSFMLGILAGAVVGGITALLLAPKSGAETRQMIRDRAMDTRDMIAQRASDTREAIQNRVTDIKQRAIRAKAAAMEDSDCTPSS